MSLRFYLIDILLENYLGKLLVEVCFYNILFVVNQLLNNSEIYT